MTHSKFGRRRFLVSLVFSSLLLVWPAFAEGPNPEVPELEPLNAIVGSWEGTFAVNTGPAETKVTLDAAWTMGGRYVMSKNTMRGKGPESQVMVLWTYDVQQKLYRRWFFFSTGGSFQEWGTWDANSKTFHFRGSDFTGPEGDPVPFPDRSAPPPSSKTESTVKILGPDSKEWTVQIRNASGGVITARGTATRHKK